jgi:cell division protein FtsI/penicillin-binding protein 2
VVVVLAAAGTFVVLKTQADQRHARAKSQAEAVDVSKEFLADWSRGDAPKMAALATPETASYVQSEIPKLVTSLQISSQTYEPGLVTSRGSAAAAFHANVVVQGLGTWTYDNQLPLKKVDGHWKVAFSSTTVYPDLGPNDTLVRNRQLGARGQIITADGRALRGRDVELDGNLLGVVGPFTAADAKTAGPFFQAGDVGGTSGLERAYNATLAGKPGGSLTIRTANGTAKKTLIDSTVVPGTNVPISIDFGMQRAAESALSGLGALPGSLVAIDVTSGKVLALANAPLNGFGRAAKGTYPPGSTCKISTTTAALMSGKSASTPLTCTPSATVGGRTFVNAEGESYGTISLEDAFAKSCNTAFVGLSQDIPRDSLAAAAALFGFSSKPLAEIDQATGGPLPIASFGGSVPAATDAADFAGESIGQGRIVASPLQMASVAAAVASGTWRQPYVSATAPTGNPEHALPAAVVPVLRQFMADVVANGTAKPSGLPSGTFGKTGTAEYGTKTPLDTISWFIGWRGNVAFACQAGGDGTDGGFGADAAAHACARFLNSIS